MLDCVILLIAGGQPPEGVWLIIGRVATAYYFIHFVILLPLIGWFETPLKLPTSITQPVLKPAGEKA